jgi:hypothetical protein
MTIDTVELLDQLGTAVRRDAAQRRRRNRLTLATAVVILVVGAGVGVAGTYDDWWTNNAPAVQPSQLGEVAQENKSVGIDLDLSKKATVARTDDAVLDAVATNGGSGYCMSLFVGTRHMGSSCTTVSDSEYRTRADDSHWIGYGRILDANAASLDLSGAGLASHVPLERGGFFLFDIPQDRWAALDGRSGDIAILDPAGKPIRRTCIYVGNAPGTDFPGGGGLGDHLGQCADMAPILPRPELDRARKLVSLTLTHPFSIYEAGDTISVWTAPNRGGGSCTFLASSDTAPTATATNGIGCTGKDVPLPADALLPGVSFSLAGGEYATFVQGSAGSDVARVELLGADGATVPVALGGGAFLAELPATPKVGKEPGQIPGGPYRVVGYDAAGKEVAARNLQG